MPAAWQDLFGSWPLPRYEHGLAYDSDRKRIVIFGGRDGSSALFAETWEWDGARKGWIERADTAGSPAERAGLAMAYDPVRKKTFLFGGWQPSAGVYANDQWEWDGPTGTWQERLTTGMQPSARYGHTMVYDPDRARVVMFGGFGGPSRTRLNDIWEWDGTGWMDRTPSAAATKPTARYDAAMVYDASRKKIVLYGGNTGTAAPPGGTYVDETWEWDGAAGAWTMATVTTGMSISSSYVGNSYHALAYDSDHGRVYFYGAWDHIYQLNPGMPATWTLATTSKTDTATPPAPSGGVMYDPSQGSMFTFTNNTGYYRDTWEWYPTDGTWANRSTPDQVATPVGRTYPAMAYDSKHGNLMLFGGSLAGASRQDTWQWSSTGQSWTDLTNLNAKPTGRYQSAMVYDSVRDQLVMFGGYNSSTGSLDDLWTWSPMNKNWSPITISGTRPTARSGHLMYYDPVHDKVMMFFGAGNQIWELDPKVDPTVASPWKDRSPTSGFPNIGNPEYAYDHDRGKLVVFGQNYNGTTYLPDFWEWDVTTGLWAERPIPAGATRPYNRTGHTISYDGARRVVVLFGGYISETGIPAAYANDSWEWDGNTGIWSETTPTGMKPLPRQNSLMIFDPLHGSTLLTNFGNYVPSDNTYGPNELWEYAPNSAPRPNGAACSVATASACMSGNCVDGVCCAQSSCPGMCQACNVPGKGGVMGGTCANVLPGTPDDSCGAGQSCDANQQCKSQNGQACGSFTDCGSGHCADGVCCDTDCNDVCKVCNLNGKRGACSFVPAGNEDPVGAPACVSDPDQGRACDGNGVCANVQKANGQPCTAGKQCTSGNCIDGVCCNSTCTALCYACNVPLNPGNCTTILPGQQDHSASMTTASGTTVVTCDSSTQYCLAGNCITLTPTMTKKMNGQSCGQASDCASNLCVDGLCCNGACTGQCQACNVPGQEGNCVNVPAGGTDANGSPACTGTGQFCDGTGHCQNNPQGKSLGYTCKAGTECLSGFCVDGVCCETACTDTCRACNLQPAGACSLVVPGSTDTNATTPCVTPNYCVGGGTCTKGLLANGTACVHDNDCGSNHCTDGVCCDSECAGKCRTCKNATGTCSFMADGSDDRHDCTGEGICGGVCDGQGACRFPPSGLHCRDDGCQSDGYIGTSGTCDGAGNCIFGVSQNCNGFICTHDAATNKDVCVTSCSTDPMCVTKNYCATGGTECPVDLDNGSVCNRDTQCKSGHCAFANPGDPTGFCCDRTCDKCGTCDGSTDPTMKGTCIPTPAGTDPSHDCIDSASDPTGKCGGTCNGKWACEFPKLGTVCDQCKTCDGSGKCNVKPDDDATCGDNGTIACTGLDTDCKHYRDIKVNRCAALGMCKEKNSPNFCTDFTITCDGGSDGSSSLGDGSTPAGDAAGTGDGSMMKRGGGGGCCSVASSRGSKGEALLELFAFAAVAGVARRRRRI
jgi:hypothetical protein